MTVISVLITDHLRRDGESFVAIFTSEPKVYFTSVPLDSQTTLQLNSGPDAISQLRNAVEDTFPAMSTERRTVGQLLWDDFVSLLIRRYFELQFMQSLEFKELASVAEALFPEITEKRST